MYVNLYCIFCLPDIIRKNVTQFFQVCDVEQGNLLIYQSAEVGRTQSCDLVQVLYKLS